VPTDADWLELIVRFPTGPLAGPLEGRVPVKVKGAK
jgi:hypothetical protein